MHSIGCGEEGYGRTGPCICSQLNFTESTLGLQHYELIIYVCFKSRLFPEYLDPFIKLAVWTKTFQSCLSSNTNRFKIKTLLPLCTCVCVYTHILIVEDILACLLYTFSSPPCAIFKNVWIISFHFYPEEECHLIKNIDWPCWLSIDP